MKNTCLIVSLALFVAGGSQLNAQSFSVTYGFDSVTTSSGTTDPTAVPTAANVTFGSFSAGGYTGSPNAGGRFSFTGNPTGGVNGDNNFADFTGSLSLTKYFTVTLTPATGFSLDLNSISFTLGRSSTGIRDYAVRSSLDSFGVNLPASISPANASLAVDGNNDFQIVTDNSTTVSLTGSLVTLGSDFDDITGPVTLRFYGWNAEGSGGTFSIDNVNFVGNLTAVPTPEPSTLAMAALGGIALVSMLRRK
ncbi:MAG TPA: PEP-CTERM sorting domain-containing protein [Verrucomicrobiae bacterium]|jgi:hypothetical protein